MKTPFVLLTPLAVLLISACAGPGGPAYVDYGPGPDPRPGYYWNGTVYVEGENPYYHHGGEYNRSETNVNDVNVNRTYVNERTVNRTSVNNTRVNNRTVNQRTTNRATQNGPTAQNRQTNAHKRTQKPNPQNQPNQPGNQ